jgi:hypothetical protein
MAKYKKVISAAALVSACAVVLLPVVSLGYSIGDPLVPPCGPDPVTGKCLWGWQELMGLVNNLMTFGLKYMAVPIAACMGCYAGGLLIFGGSETASIWTKVKSICLNTVLGLILALAAWLIVRLILTILGWDGGWIGF